MAPRASSVHIVNLLLSDVITVPGLSRCLIVLLCDLSEQAYVMLWQVGPWCVPLPEGTRICHLRTNMGLDWGQNVVPVLPDLGALPTDILVCEAATCLCQRTLAA